MENVIRNSTLIHLDTMKNTCDAINVFNYFDYREYLNDCFKKIKSKNPDFHSGRFRKTFAFKAIISYPNS